MVSTRLRTPAVLCRHALAVTLALILACCLTFSVQKAWAEGTYLTAEGSAQQFEIEALEAAYKAAQARLDEANARVAENQKKIDAIMEKLPAQQERTYEAIKELYFLENDRLYYYDMMLQSESLDSLLKELEYFDRVSKKNLTELNKLKEMKAELELARIALNAAQAEAEEQAQIARSSLAALQDERAAKQSGGQANALAQGGSSTVIDGADWYMTEEEFVNEWGPRIDAYLAGSPMEGTGETFALMSFRYCVDPRWSPAISNTESSKGRKCIRPYNAWGWGAADSDPYNLASEWGSWEEAIEAHISGLANGYGYTISKSAAKSYCSSPDSWYENTLSEMALI